MVAGDANDAFTASVIDFLGDVMPFSTPAAGPVTGAPAP
jgi:hypothetical protein